MAFLNSLGRAVHGVGDGLASIDNAAITASMDGYVLVRSGAIGWLDEHRACLAGRLQPIPLGWDDPNGIGVFAYDVRTGQLDVLAERASVKGYANGGNWVARVPGNGDYGSFGELPEKYVSAIGPDGRAVYAPHAGQPYRWLDDDALLYDGLLEPGSLQLCGNRTAIACTPEHDVVVFGLSLPQTVGKLSTPRRVVTDAGEEWLLSYAVDQGRILLHPWSSTVGYVVWDLSRLGAFYGYDAVSLDDVIRVVGAIREGEQPGELITIDVSLHAPRITLRPTPPEPEPEPDPMPELPASLEDDVRAERAKYPATLQSEDYGKILNAVAWKNRAQGWGLSEKPQGNHVPAPHTRVDTEGHPVTVWVAYDILHHKPTNTLWGCFSDAGVNWGLEDYHNDPDGRPWLAPMDPAGVEEPEPDPEPEPEPPNEDLQKLQQQVEALQRQSDALMLRVEALERKPPPVVTWPSKLRLRGNTTAAGSSFLRHAHGVDDVFTVEPVE